MGYSVQRRWGDGVRDADEAVIDEALADLDVRHDPEHPDTWLDSHDTGYSLIAYESGALVLEPVEAGGEPRHLAAVSRADVKRLWLALARGDLDEVMREPWQPGYQPGGPH